LEKLIKNKNFKNLNQKNVSTETFLTSKIVKSGKTLDFIALSASEAIFKNFIFCDTFFRNLDFIALSAFAFCDTFFDFL